LLGMFTSDAGLSFWEMLKPVLHNDWLVVKAISVGEVRHNLILMSVTTFLPVLVMAIRWSANFGDSSRMGTLLASQIFHLIHVVVFGVCVWIMFDPPFSPGQLSMGSPALTFYYLSALAIGYYCGYFLLVFGKKAIPTRRNPRPEKALPGVLNIFSPLIYWGTFAAAAFVAGTLAYKNLPLIHASNDDTLKQYAQLTVQSLPKEGGILLSDSEGVTSSQQTRTLLIQAELARIGRAKDYLVVDTQSLNYAPYLRFLHRKSPDKWPQMVGPKDMGGVNPMGLLTALNLLSQSNTICYLNPSFGYYFEVFYLEPHGLVYQMKKLPEDTLLPPPPSTNLLAENEKFWAQVMADQFLRHDRRSRDEPRTAERAHGRRRRPRSTSQRAGGIRTKDGGGLVGCHGRIANRCFQKPLWSGQRLFRRNIRDTGVERIERQDDISRMFQRKPRRKSVQSHPQCCGAQIDGNHSFKLLSHILQYYTFHKNTCQLHCL